MASCREPALSGHVCLGLVVAPRPPAPPAVLVIIPTCWNLPEDAPSSGAPDVGSLFMRALRSGRSKRKFLEPKRSGAS